MNEDICEIEGAAVETNRDILKCLWLKENTIKNIVGRCKNEVYLNDFKNFIFF
jgi:hypothetical protein